jgi:hypothetical protein
MPLRMDTLNRWIDWLLSGHNGPELAQVLRYLRREVAAGRRNPGALKLSCLLDPARFEEDLMLARATRSGRLDPDAAIERPPDAPARTPKAPPPAAPAAINSPAAEAALEQLRKLKTQL